MRSVLVGFLASVMVVVLSGAVLGPPQSGAPEDVQAAACGTPSRVSVQHANAKPDTPIEDHSAVSRVAEKLRPAMVLLKAPGGGGGTGFVISRKHRLVATAAHVADCFSKPGGLLAFREGTTVPCVVDRVWYHPRVKRQPDAFLTARSDNPTDGDIVCSGFDIAIVHLSEGCAELPAELQIAPSATCDSVPGRLIGVLGYYGSKPRAIPTAGHPEIAEFTESMALLPANLLKSSNAELSSDSLIFFEGADLEGASGGPCFLEDGLVVGVFVGWTTAAKVGVDAVAKVVFLRELLRYHKLDSLLPGPAEMAQPPKDQGPDPLLGRYRTVIRLTRHASQLRQRGSYSRAVEACNEALSLEPEHGGALLERSKAYFNYVVTHWDALKDEARTKFIVWAGNDAHQCSSNYPHLIWPRLFLDEMNIYLAFIKSDPSGFTHVLSSVNDELANADFIKECTPTELAFLYNLRAQANDFLGKFEDAEVDFGESIKLAPGEAQWYSNRAQFWERRGMRVLAQVDRWTARSLRDGLIGHE